MEVKPYDTLHLFWHLRNAYVYRCNVKDLESMPADDVDDVGGSIEIVAFRHEFYEGHRLVALGIGERLDYHPSDRIRVVVTVDHGISATEKGWIKVLRLEKTTESLGWSIVFSIHQAEDLRVMRPCNNWWQSGGMAMLKRREAHTALLECLATDRPWCRPGRVFIRRVREGLGRG
jgi:hypothetical protein